MARYAIDAPTLLHLVQHGFEGGEHQLVAPNAIRTDAFDLLFAAVSRGELTETAALALHERMTALKIRTLGDRVSRRTAWNLARDHGWDGLQHAEYLAVCVLQADAFVTVDPEMASRANGIVPLAPPDSLVHT
ncbi:MAG: hypothetical protein ABMA25_10455 [Ilumatobacteraceae bacterium]